MYYKINYLFLSLTITSFACAEKYDYKNKALFAIVQEIRQTAKKALEQDRELGDFVPNAISSWLEPNPHFHATTEGLIIQYDCTGQPRSLHTPWGEILLVEDPSCGELKHYTTTINALLTTKTLVKGCNYCKQSWNCKYGRYSIIKFKDRDISVSDCRYIDEMVAKKTWDDLCRHKKKIKESWIQYAQESSSK